MRSYLGNNRPNLALGLFGATREHLEQRQYSEERPTHSGTIRRPTNARNWALAAIWLRYLRAGRLRGSILGLADADRGLTGDADVGTSLFAMARRANLALLFDVSAYLGRSERECQEYNHRYILRLQRTPRMAA